MYETWRVTFFQLYFEASNKQHTCSYYFLTVLSTEKAKVRRHAFGKNFIPGKKRSFHMNLFCYGENGSTYQIKILFGFPQFVSK